MRERDISGLRKGVQGATAGGMAETEERWAAEVEIVTGVFSAKCLGQSSLLLWN